MKKEFCNSCQKSFLKIESFSKDKEEIVRKVAREVGPIAAIQKLRELTNASLRDAKHWFDHSGEYYLGKTIPCPFCGELLRTAEAKQCRFCNRDWHDENNIEFL